MKALRRHALMPPMPPEGSVERELRAAVERSASELTIADLVVATGVPGSRVEVAISRLLGEYSSGAAVTESGDLLYRFEEPVTAGWGASPRMLRILKGIGKAARNLSRGLAKRGPLIFMTGYFALFLTIPFPPALILLALIMSSWSDMDMLDHFGAPRCRGTVRLQAPTALLHEYLFGSADLREQRTKDDLLTTLSAVRNEMGVVSLQDILASTGLPPAGAQEYLDQFLVRFTGEPEVTAGGRVVYRFPELLKTARAHPASDLRDYGEPSDGAVETERRRKHRLIAIMNFANILFSVYYGVLSIRAMVEGAPAARGTGSAHPGIAVLFNAIYSFAAESHSVFVLPGLLFGLGVVPFGVASLFFALNRRTAGRKADGRREEAERRLRREVYSQVFAGPERVDPARIRVPFRVARGRNVEKAVARVIDELAASYHAEIEDIGEGNFIYHFPELGAEHRELLQIRRSVMRAQRASERIIFDSRDRVT